MADMHYHSIFHVAPRLKVAITATGPLSAKHLRRIIHMVEIDLEWMDREEAEAASTIEARSTETGTGSTRQGESATGDTGDAP